MQTLPNFPRSMPNLRLLELSPQLDRPDWDTSIDPFGSFSHTLRYLSLCNVPLYPSFLKLRTLTEFTLRDHKFTLPVDTLLAIVEENPSLEIVSLAIGFTEPSLRRSQRRVVTRNRLRRLSITGNDAMDAQALVFGISLPRGANLEIRLEETGEVNNIPAGISTGHLMNLPSPTFMKYRSSGRHIRLSGPNGSFSFDLPTFPSVRFLEFPLLPLNNVRELWLERPTYWLWTPVPFPSSFFPALTALVIKGDIDISNTLSILFSTPASSPSLRTLAFSDCDITEEFMEKLTRFASNRKNTTWTWLHRVVIVHLEGVLPREASFRKLEEHVPVVDVLVDMDLPTDLT
jgi:hypothetical protein